MTKISLIVPVGGPVDELDRCVESVSRQTFRDFELILIFDGPQRQCVFGEQLDTFSHGQVQTLTLDRPRGAGAARNKGIEVASHELLMFLDSDDELLPGAMEKVWNGYVDSQSPDLVFYSAFRKEYASGKVDNPNWFLNLDRAPAELNTLKNLETNRFLLSSPAAWLRAAKRDFIVKNSISFQEIHRANDVSFYMQQIALCSSVGVVAEPLLVYHYGNPHSITGDVRAHALSRFEALEFGLKQCRKKIEYGHQGIWSDLSTFAARQALGAASDYSKHSGLPGLLVNPKIAIRAMRVLLLIISSLRQLVVNRWLVGLALTSIGIRPSKLKLPFFKEVW